jgi:hypothetical protein
MARKSWIVILVTAAVILAGLSLSRALLYSQKRLVAQSAQVPMPQSGAQAYIIRFIGDKTSTGQVFDGGVALDSGTILQVDGWRFLAKDSITGNSWKLSTRMVGNGAGGNTLSTTQALFDNGVVVTAVPASQSSTFTVTPASNAAAVFKKFTFQPKDLSFGTATPYLNGAASVEPTLPYANLTGALAGSANSTEYLDEQDFPAYAQKGDDIYVSYVEFHHSDRTQEGSGALTAPGPTDFSKWARTPGADQVFVMHYSKSTRTWDAPVPVSAASQDIMQAAVAVDGQNQVWVFWSANPNWNTQGVSPNFDIYAQRMTGSPLAPAGSPIQMTTNAGNDLNPVAAADSNGNVWVAWQAYRNGTLEILASVQTGAASMSQETAVSFSQASNWDPAIAASPTGDIAISWDTYDKGDYDVYFRRLRLSGQIQMDAPVPVAASRNFEARSSIVYDAQNRLWVAYETSVPRWGKNWGTYDSTGVSLYDSHTVKLKCFDSGSNAYATATDLNGVLPTPNTMPATFPNPAIAQSRKPGAGAALPTGPRHSIPRVAVDADGQVYLAFRVITNMIAGVGGVWAENVIYYDGQTWHGPVTLAATDGLLTNRPALVPLAGGDLMIVSGMDHRQSPLLVSSSRTNVASINYDLYAAELQVPRAQSVNLTPIPAETVAAPETDAASELAQLTAIRNYRVGMGGQGGDPRRHRATQGGSSGQEYSLLRGEFHRHTEISGDGRNDGLLADGYRYLLDVADMDWSECCDHDNGNNREYSWWIEQKMTDAYWLAGKYTSIFGYERSVDYPEGHRIVLFANRGVRPLNRLPLGLDASANDTMMLYRYLRQLGGITASHTSGTSGMGTDWRNNDPTMEPVVEVYQGDRQSYEIPGALRAISAADPVAGYNAKGWISLALQMGYRFGFESSSDHVSTHMSYGMAIVTSPTRQGIMDALSKRHIYGATDNILADVHCGNNIMGDAFTVETAPTLTVNLTGTANFAKVYVMKDGNAVYSFAPNTATVSFTWQDTSITSGQTSYYYVRGEQTPITTNGGQSAGDMVWTSPMWITRQ